MNSVHLAKLLLTNSIYRARTHTCVQCKQGPNSHFHTVCTCVMRTMNTGAKITIEYHVQRSQNHTCVQLMPYQCTGYKHKKVWHLVAFNNIKKSKSSNKEEVRQTPDMRGCLSPNSNVKYSLIYFDTKHTLCL